MIFRISFFQIMNIVEIFVNTRDLNYQIINRLVSYPHDSLGFSEINHSVRLSVFRKVYQELDDQLCAAVLSEIENYESK